MARTTYSPELGERICAAIAASGDGLAAICAANEGFPNPASVYEWAVGRPDFAEMYARAREAQGHHQADLALQVATTATDAQLARLAYDARKWHAAKLAPRVWSDKTQHANFDGTADAPSSAPLVAELQALIAARQTPADGG